MVITKDEIFKMLSQTMRIDKITFGNLMLREMDIFTATSYDSEEYRCWFFHLHGSPTTIIGFIRSEPSLGYRLVYSYAGDKNKNFYFTKNLVKTTYSGLHSGIEPKCFDTWLYNVNKQPTTGGIDGSEKSI